MRVFVSVGTDHHPFDRLVGWAERWAADHPGDRVVVQHGHASVPADPPSPLWQATRLLDAASMADELGRADVVVVSAGPGGVMDARAAGRLPVAVARRHQLGEHVDDHQLAFVRHLDQRGLARCVEDEAGFRAVLEEAAAHPASLRIEPEERVPPGIAEVGRLIDRLVRGTP